MQVAKSKRDYDGIAVHHSQASLHANDINARLDSWLGANDQWLKLLEGLGFQPRFVTTSQIEGGRLVKDGYKALILPYSQAISEKECEAISRFVNSGGMVVADLVPGLLNGKCRPLDAGSLDELFGVRQKAIDFAPGQPSPQPSAIHIRGPLGDAKLEAAFDGVLSNRDVAKADASSLSSDGKTMFYRRSGKGSAFLLNFSVTGACRTPDGRDSFGRLMETLLAEAGVSPALKVFDAAGKRVQDVILVQRKVGDVRLAGILLSAKPGVTGFPGATLELPKPYYLCNLITGESLGRMKSVKLGVEAGRLKLFSLLEDSPEELRITAPNAKRGELLKVTVQGKQKALNGHVVRLDVLGPAGEALPHYSRRIMIEGDGAEAEVPMALNDPPGKWTLKLTDIPTSLTTTAKVTVE